ncbi:alanine racemase [Bacillus sp. T3]|uniref:alanine racemase n=1 Tax=Bacillus sp. T3 TaxID=467262 RepID=UPI002980B56A|nr:alanine racemase [Bacillus sp. T3]
MREQSYRDTWAEISLDAIKHNTSHFKNYINSNVKLMGVVKADGYGHGAVPIAKAILAAGADYLAVAILDEALELRDAGIQAPILVLGFTPNRSIKDAIKADVDLTVFSETMLNEIIFYAEQLRKSVCIHIKVDTGMSRIGVQTADEALRLAEIAKSSIYIRLKGLFTHFARADDEDPTYTYTQYQKFQNVISHLENHQIEIPLKHCCNSAGTMKFPEMHLDMVRVGISLYGLYPDQTLTSHSIPLQQAMTLKTTIVALKIVPAHRSISYGGTKIPTQATKIATLPIGYADGLSRLLSNRGTFLLNGHKVVVAGRVCMDQTMIEIPDTLQCKEGDVVTIFGVNENAFLSVEEMARLMGTINYEVVCQISKRVPRSYVRQDTMILYALT